MEGLHAAFVGRVGGFPELRYTQGGKPLLAFSVAVQDQKSAEKGEPPTWIRVTAWEQQAEALQQTVQKGSEVYVEGRLKLSSWETNGETRTGLNCSAWLVQPLGAIGKKAPPKQGPERKPAHPAGRDIDEWPAA